MFYSQNEQNTPLLIFYRAARRPLPPLPVGMAVQDMAH
jgi:hypothetical protein